MTKGGGAHLERLVAAGVGLLLAQGGGLLVGGGQLMPLEHQRLLELLLRLGLQQLLPEGDVGEESSERPAQLHGRLGAFLQRRWWRRWRRRTVSVTKSTCKNIMSDVKLATETAFALIWTVNLEGGGILYRSDHFYFVFGFIYIYINVLLTFTVRILDPETEIMIHIVTSAQQTHTHIHTHNREKLYRKKDKA